ncbi:hypothetical protein D3C72_2526590 [compost metagenome]
MVLLTVDEVLVLLVNEVKLTVVAFAPRFPSQLAQCVHQFFRIFQEGVLLRFLQHLGDQSLPLRSLKIPRG